MIERCDRCPVADGACLPRRLGVRRMCELDSHREAIAAWGATGGPTNCGNAGAQPPTPAATAADFERVMAAVFSPPRLTADQKQDDKEIALECPHRRTISGCRKILCDRWKQKIGFEVCMACVRLDRQSQG